MCKSQEPCYRMRRDLERRVIPDLLLAKSLPGQTLIANGGSGSAVDIPAIELERFGF